ncbi:MAG: PD-(D/E)XK nuclease family protein [Gammaproteobacteria bacterium]|nr:PD-(D/E)XK nuclease family protein [Gammaproteobacteria bacterium]
MTRNEAWSSTTLRLYTEHCARALDYAEDGIDHDRDTYAPGIVAHAILQAVGEQTQKVERDLTDAETDEVMRRVVAALVENGREFRGKHEPPTNTNHAATGLEIARDYLAFYPFGFQKGARFEVELVDGNLSAIIDYLWVGYEDGDELAPQTLVIRDYKSSWAAGPGELETLQRKIQALVALAAYPDVDKVRREVVNLRTGAVYADEIWPKEEYDRKRLGEWGADIDAIIRAVPKRGGSGRPATPGARCMGCPYWLTCDEAYPAAMLDEDMPNTLENVAAAYAICKAFVKNADKVLRSATKEQPIETAGSRIGYQAVKRRELADDAARRILDYWTDAGGQPFGLIKSLNLGVRNAENMANALFADKKSREQFLEEVIQEYAARRFGMWRGKL